VLDSVVKELLGMAALKRGRPSSRTRPGSWLDGYRGDHVCERIGAALQREGVPDVGSLATLIASRPAGSHTRFRVQLGFVGVRLFRDPAQFELLRKHLLAADSSVEASRQRLVGRLRRRIELYSVAVLLQRSTRSTARYYSQRSARREPRICSTR